MTATTKAKKYKHETAVLESGALQARCYENGVLHWEGWTRRQDELGLGLAHALASQDLDAHVQETGHTPFKHRHGGPR